MSPIIDFFYYTFRKLFSYNWHPKFITHWMPQKIQLLNYPKMTGDEIVFSFRQAKLKIKFIESDIAHFWWILNEDTNIHRAINNFHQNIYHHHKIIPFKLIPDEKKKYHWLIQTDALIIEVAMDGNIQIYTADKNKLVHLYPPQFGSQGFIQNFDNILHLNGLGVQSNNTISYGPKIYHLHNEAPRSKLDGNNKETSWNVPMYLLNNEYGSTMMYYVNSYSSRLDLRKQPYSHQFAGGELRYYISVGELNTLLKNYADISGYPTSPPSWAFNNQMITNINNKSIRPNFKISGLILKQDYNNFLLKREDLASFENISLMVLPSISKKEKEFTDDKYLLNIAVPTTVGKTAVFPDIANHEAQAWWANKHISYVKQQIAGLWLHNNEPCSLSILMDRTLPYDTQYDDNGIKRTHREIHNLYGYLLSLTMNRYRSDIPWIMSTSGWAGSQKYASSIINEISASWKGLKLLIPIFINMGLSGCPFFGLPSFNTKNQILLIRYLQIAIFSPISLITFDTVTEPLIHTLLNFRQQLYSILNILKNEACLYGWPLIRPLFWKNSISHYYKISDQFMLGNDIIISPVITKLQKRKCNIIEGEWYLLYVSPTLFFYNKIIAKKFESVKIENYEINLNAKLYEVPMFFRSGSIFPISMPNNELKLVVFPGNHTNVFFFEINKPEILKVKLFSSQLIITWRRGSLIWGKEYKKLSVIIVSNNNKIWEGKHIHAKPFKRLVFKKNG